MSDSKDPRKRRAAALAYSGVGAPRLVAKGDGEIAARIEQVAEQHGIPLIQDAHLTSLLGSIPLGDEIPENLYLAVAEVLAHVYRIGGAIDSFE